MKIIATLGLVLLASAAHATPKALIYGDSKLFAGCCTAASAAGYVAAARPDYTWTASVVPGRDTADTADLVAYLAANNYALVVLDLAINDPSNLADYDPTNTMDRLSALCDLAQADGATCVVLTPLHGPTTRGLQVDHEQFTGAVAALIRASGETYVDAREFVSIDTWQSECADFYRIHPNTDVCRHLLGDFIAAQLP